MATETATRDQAGRFEPEDRVSLTELAQELNVALSTVWRWTTAGVRGHKLKTFPVGGRTYTTERDYRQFRDKIRGGRKPASEPKPKTAKHQKVGRRLSNDEQK